MAQARVMHGARAILYIGGRPRGIFTNVSYAVNYNVASVDGLGRFGPHEIVLTGMDPISVSASGWRLVSSQENGQRGPHVEAAVPKLQDLLRHEDTTITIVDRQNPDGRPLLNVVGIRPTGYSTSINAKGLQEFGVSFVGLVANDETGEQYEEGAATL